MNNYGYSASLKINKQRVKGDGTATIYIQLLYEREREMINMNFGWPVDRIDFDENKLLARHRNDKECDDNNLIIKKELGKINEVFRYARLADRRLTMSQVKKELENWASKDDFIDYARRKIEERTVNNLIGYATSRTHKSAIETLATWRPAMQFSEIDHNTVDLYKAWMVREKGYTSDTAYTKLNIFRTYLSQAKEDGFIFYYPFGGKATMPKTSNRIDFVEEEDLQKLIRWYNRNKLPANHWYNQAVRGFLFICYTGLRISDIYQMTHRNIQKGSLKFIMEKSDNNNQLEITVPLHPFARKMIITTKGSLFELPAEVNFRVALKQVAELLKIESKISPHIGRHTFATRFLAHGGRVEVLQLLLGHTNIGTTMKYVHVTEQRKKDEINLLPQY